MTGFLRIVLLALLALPTAAQTQLDPGFLAQELYQPAEQVLQAQQLSDGSRIVVVSYLWRVNGNDVYNGLVKFLPSGQLDTAFRLQVEQYSFTALSVAEAPGNKLIVELLGPGTFGSQVHNGLVRLNFDGSLDTSFRPQPAVQIYSEIPYLVQPDGKIVVSNAMALNTSQSTRILARLNADGTADTGFGSQLAPVFSQLTSPAVSSISCLRQQPDGKLLAAVYIANTASAGPRLVRLLPTGAPDGSFFYPAPLGIPRTMALQPDGKILVSDGYINHPLLTRLLPSGLVDGTFQAPPLVLGNPGTAAVIQVQANGRVLVAGARERNSFAPEANLFVVRLLDTGALDASWQPPMYGDYQAKASSIQLLPSGQLLVAGSPKLYASAMALPTGIALLDATGAYVPSFAPLLQQDGGIFSMILQTDGKIVAGGAFSEINGVTARNLARFNRDGTLDAAFTANCAVMGGTPYVNSLALQPDGKIVLGGGFAVAGGRSSTAVARLLPSGLADPAFASPLQPHSTLAMQQANHLALQGDGQIILTGYLHSAGAAQDRRILRLGTTGQVDASFQPIATSDDEYYNRYPVLVQPNGRIVTANLSYQARGAMTYEKVEALLPSGAVDPTFNRLLATRSSQASIITLEQYPDGRLLVGGNFFSYSGTPAGCLVRLSTNGALDASFTSVIGSFVVRATALQPNGRILAAGTSFGINNNPPIIRLLSDGSFDASFVRTQGPAQGSWVRKLLVQPDGGILVAGEFYTVAGQTRMGLVRLLDANVLRVASRQTEAATTAYPVPTHGDLHLTLDATARPQQVQLLDALGRVVLTQAVSQPVMTMATAGLPAGTYLLRVRYATSSVTRRVVVE